MAESRIITGDCVEVLARLKDNCIDAIVTDPPYGLSFMGKRWDYDVPGVDAFTQMLRVLKPGGRLLCFAGTRTMHRMWCNIEDAGFTIEDTIAWMYGSGFPKHKSKLKPAYEPVCVARKGGVSELNIDACRIAGEYETRDRNTEGGRSMFGLGAGGGAFVPASGRWPANVVLDEEAAAVLDAQTGTLTSGKMKAGTRRKSTRGFGGAMPDETLSETIGDSGGASRFFYCAKASRKEREAGLDGAPTKPGGSNAKGFTEDVAAGNDRNRPVANHHPTVKPISVMQWLVRLVAKPGDVLLDSFVGTGTTGIVCAREDIHFVGIELSEEYAEIARQRIAAA